MKDVIVIAIVVGFFALCAAYVTWCERMLAADTPDRVLHDAEVVGVSPVAASSEATDVRRQ